MKRLFISIDLPDALTLSLRGLDPGLKGVRWLPAHSMHLTVSFIGNVGDEQETGLRAALGQVAVTPFFLPVQGVGCFPSPAAARVLWVGVGTGHPQLFALHRKVQDAVLAAGLEPDLRRFQPHITLARCQGARAGDVRQFLRSNEDFDAGMIKVNGFGLYSSLPTPSGSIYTVELSVTPATALETTARLPKPHTS